jgi:hypothetical protein
MSKHVLEVRASRRASMVRDLADAARVRLGMSPSHKNVLLRVVIGDLDRTLTSEEANRLRDAMCEAVHVGKWWAAREATDLR